MSSGARTDDEGIRTEVRDMSGKSGILKDSSTTRSRIWGVGVDVPVMNGSGQLR